MVKQKEEQRPFKVGDAVFTPISERPATIIKIEEGRYPHSVGIYPFDSDNTYKEYTVELAFPHLKHTSFKKVEFKCTESELRR